MIVLTNRESQRVIDHKSFLFSGGETQVRISGNVPAHVTIDARLTRYYGANATSAVGGPRLPTERGWVT